jgi:hypothetical protein
MSWIITGWYKGCQYAAYGDDTKATVPGWLWEWLQLDTGDTGGVLRLIPAGPAVKLDDLSAMSPDDVVAVLQSMTNISDISGDLPPREVFPIFGDTLPVN